MAKKKTEAMAMPSIDKDWRAQSDCDTLERAEEIKQDGARLKAARGYAAKKRERLARIAKLEKQRI